MKFLEFDPHFLSEEQWKSYFESRERIHIQQSPDDPIPSRKARIEYMKAPHPDYFVSWWRCELECGAVVGMGGTWWVLDSAPNYEQAKEVGYADMILDKEHASKENYIQFEMGRCIEDGIWLSGVIQGSFGCFGRGILRSDVLYLKLEHIGSKYSAYCSSDGEN